MNTKRFGSSTPEYISPEEREKRKIQAITNEVADKAGDLVIELRNCVAANLVSGEVVPFEEDFGIGYRITIKQIQLK